MFTALLMLKEAFSAEKYSNPRYIKIHNFHKASKQSVARKSHQYYLLSLFIMKYLQIKQAET